jgi:tRNA A-37 threonylcarbamoyl transferase component Bud32
MGSAPKPRASPEELPPTSSGGASSPGGGTVAQMLGTRYQVTARLGAGAFGEVYRARDSLLGRDIAVKTIRLESFVEPSQLEEVKKRFLREAQVAARLTHPNIVTTHDIVAEAGRSFIVMELVSGETLQSRLATRGRLPVDETVRLMDQAARALDHAHENGVVHRDVKPANIMVEAAGTVKVMDFGIAKLEAGTNLTSTGLILGTPNYMSPEQARGERVDGRSDLFSLGCVLYECITGRKPFAGESVTAILVKILTEDPPPVDFDAIGLPREIGEVLRQATAKDPARRFATGAAMVDALHAAVGPTHVTLRAEAGVPAGPPTARPAAPPASAATAASAVSSLPPSAGAARAESTPARPISGAWASRRRRPLLVAAAALVVLGTAAAAVKLLPIANVSERAAADQPRGFVVEERPDPVGRSRGKPSRVQVTVPAGTRLELVLREPISSASAREGDAVEATLVGPLVVEGVEAAPAGTTVAGQVAEVASAAKAGGRGRMTIRFEAVVLPGGRASVEARSLTLRAPAPSKRKRGGIIGGLAGVGAAVGGIIGGKKGAVAGTVLGGAAGVAVVETGKGRDVSLPANAAVTIELTAPATLMRPRLQ